MKKILLQVLFLFFCIPYMQAQENIPSFNITGKIVDAKTNEAIEYATVTFKSKKGSDILGGISDKKGKFEISVPKGQYIITLEFLGYKTKILPSQSVTNDIHFGSLMLSEDTELLNSIEITGKKKLIEIQKGKLIYNVSEDISTEGSSVMDIMSNVPFVFVENDTPTIKGRPTTVLVNGRSSSLSKSEVLKSLPAGSIEKIEVDTHPGAQYDASVTSVINIILKKGKDEGLNASITGSIGHKDIYGGLLTLNYKSKKINFFTNTSYNHKNIIKLSDSKNEYFVNGNTSNFLNENSIFDSKKNSFYTTIGTDFYLSENTTLTTSINYINLDQKSETSTNSSILDTGLVETSTNERDHISDAKNDIVEFVLSFDHNFSKEGKTVSSSLRHSNDDESNEDDITNTNSNYINEFYTQNNKFSNTEFDIKYVNPLSENSIITIGYNGEFWNSPFRNSTSTSNIDYSRDVHAGFVDYEFEKDKFYLGIGARGEFSKAAIEYLDLNSIKNFKLNSFFPSAYFQYTFNDKRAISFYYSKSIQRPTIIQLQPFEERYSATSSYIGNPELKHYFSHYFSFDYTYSSDKITFIPALFYNRLNDWHQDVTYETGEQIDGVHKLITTPQNVGYLNHYGIDIYAMYKASNTLSFNLSTQLYNFDQHGVFETINTLNQPISVDYNENTFNGIFNLTTQLKLPNAVSIQASTFYRLKSEGAVSTRKAYAYTSLALSKELFDKNATLSLNINDLFNSNQTDRDRFDTNYFSRSNIKYKYQDIILSFTYRFNQSKKNRKIDFDKKDRKPNF